jgi:hypothetical protein
MGSVFYMRSDTDCRKVRLLEALKETRGIISVACVRSGVARRTFYQWLDRDADFLRSVEDINEDAVDFAESKLLERIDAGAERSIIFFLKTKGKTRGYSESGEKGNEMLNRQIATLFHKSYQGPTSRFDTFSDDSESEE